MEQALIVGNQVFIIFIYIIIGIIAEKTKVLTKEGGASLSKLSLIIVTPAVIINSFQRELEPSHLVNLGIVFVLAVITHIISSFIACTFIKKRPDNRYRIERYAVTFANSGYMALPLVQAVLGEVGVYYLSVFIGVFNVFTWTIGITMLSPSNKPNIRKAIVNPGLLALLVGFVLHLMPFRLPEVLGGTLASVAALNTPLSMITAGIFLANIQIKKVLKNSRLYYTSFLKLVVVPLIVIGVIWLSHVTSWANHGNYIAMVIVLACACPSAGATVQFSTQYCPEYSDYGAEIVAATTLLSVITLPLMSYLIQKIT